VTDTYLTGYNNGSTVTPYLMGISSPNAGVFQLQISKNGSFTNGTLYTISDNRNGTFTTTIVGANDPQSIGSLTNCTYLNNQGGDQFITMTIGGSASVIFWTFNGTYTSTTGGNTTLITINWPSIAVRPVTRVSGSTTSYTITDTKETVLTNRTINNFNVNSQGTASLTSAFSFSVTTSATNVKTITFTQVISGTTMLFTRNPQF